MFQDVGVVSSSFTQDTIEGETYEAIKGYFNLLSKTGYANYNSVYKLLVLKHINDMLNGEYDFNVTEKDYKILSRAVKCLHGTCLIPYPEFVKNLPLMGGKKFGGRLRRTHNVVLRHTEDGNFRIIESRTKLVK